MGNVLMWKKGKIPAPGKIRQRWEVPHIRHRKCGVKDPLEGVSQLGGVQLPAWKVLYVENGQFSNTCQNVKCI